MDAQPFQSGIAKAFRKVSTMPRQLVPLIPILRDIPRWVPIHRLIWRQYYAARKVATRI